LAIPLLHQQICSARFQQLLLLLLLLHLLAHVKYALLAHHLLLRGLMLAPSAFQHPAPGFQQAAAVAARVYHHLACTASPPPLLLPPLFQLLMLAGNHPGALLVCYSDPCLAQLPC
jgi:hypothetical protein